MTTAKDVAQWMVDEIKRFPVLGQADAASQIETRFGEEFTYLNSNHNRAIHKDVLTEFQKLTGHKVVWVKQTRAWRKRQKGDGAGRQQ